MNLIHLSLKDYDDERTFNSKEDKNEQYSGIF